MVTVTLIKKMQISRKLDFSCTNQNQIRNQRPRLRRKSLLHMNTSNKSNYNSIIIRDGGKWWSKDHHLVVVKIVKNVAFSLKNV